MDRGTRTTAKTEVGLVLGKFMPLHVGHEALIAYASKHSHKVVIILGAFEGESIIPEVRFNWLRKRYGHNYTKEIHYVEDKFPKSEAPSREVSKAWADYFKRFFPDVTCIYTSEPYGEFVAEYMGIEHRCFDQPRETHPISATRIRANPTKYWDYISWAAQEYYTKKVCIYGPESVGKSTMAKLLAEHFRTFSIPEVGREMMETSYTCTFEDMGKIAEAQAAKMRQTLKCYAGGYGRQILFCDTDLLTTEVYSQHLFGQKPEVPQWVRDINQYDLYLFLDDNVPYVQDGTRLGEHTRPALKEEFWKALTASGQPFVSIKSGTWGGRFQQCVHAVEKHFNFKAFRPHGELEPTAKPWPLAL